MAVSLQEAEGMVAACKKASGLPAIAKDFVVDPAQLEWAKQAGADAVLLVAALYRYATTGQASPEFQGFSFQQPFAAR